MVSIIKVGILAILMQANSIFAQQNESMRLAFKESYAFEYKGDFAKALTSLQKLSSSPTYEIHLRSGWLYYRLGKHSLAMEQYQKAIDLKKFSVEARLGYIAPADASKQFDKAYQKYEEILSIDPYHKTANYWVGVNYYTVKKYTTAEKYFELLVNMYPFDYDANYMLAWTYLNLGRVQDARLLFEKALLYKPDDANAKDGLKRCE